MLLIQHFNNLYYLISILDEEIDPEDVTVTWYFNDTEFVESDRVQITFDGTYAKLFVAR